MESRISVQITLDRERLAYLLENRFLCIEELNYGDVETKLALKLLLLQNAVKSRQN